MRFMLTVCLVVGFAFTVQVSAAQDKEPYRPFPDSIRIEMPDARAVLVMQLKKADRDIALLESFPDSLELWVAQIEKSLPRVTGPRAVTITNGVGGTAITVTESQDKITHVTLVQGATSQLLPPGWDIQVKMKKYQATVYAQDFEGLKKITRSSLQPAMAKIQEEFKKTPCYRRRAEVRVILKDEKVAYGQCDCQGPFDFLELNASSGLGYLGNNFYPELNLDVAIKFSRSSGVPKNKLIFSYNNLFFTERNAEGNYQVFPNSFISASFNRNIASKDKISWLGFGAGYLITNNGSYFKGNTMKFFISKSVGNVRIIPELYLTDNLKTYVFGMKFNFTF